MRYAAAMAAFIAVVLPCITAGADTRGDATAKAVSWIASKQHDDGSWAKGEAANNTADTTAALVAGHGDNAVVTKALERLKSSAPAQTLPGRIGEIVAGIVAGGADPTKFDAHNYVASIESHYDANTGAYGEDVFKTTMALNGLLAATRTINAKSFSFLSAQACSGGGWGFDLGCPDGADLDTTGRVVSVYAATGKKSDVKVTAARAYMKSQQRDDGGFSLTPDLPTSSDTTAIVISAIQAIGEDPASWTKNGKTPWDALLALRDASGGFRFNASTSSPNVRSTTNALPALAGVRYPVPARTVPSPTARAATAAPTTAPGFHSYVPAPRATVTPSPTPTPTYTGPLITPVATTGAPLPFAGASTPQTQSSKVPWIIGGIAMSLAGGATALAVRYARKP